MAAAPELIPEGVTIAEALPTLGMLAALLFVVGCIYVVDYFLRALFGTVSGALGWIPWLGSKTKGAIHTVEQRVTHYLGTAESFFDNKIGVSIHKLARIGDHIGRELYGLALDGLTLAELLTGRLTWADVTRIAHDLAAPWRKALALAEGAWRRIVTIEHAVERGIGADVLPRLKALERGAAAVLEPEIAGLRERTKALEDEYAHLFKWIRKHEGALGIATITGAVAIALARLGGSWIRCNNWRRIGRFGCGLPSGLLDDLLASSVLALVATDICDFANAVETTAQAFSPVLMGLVDVEDALVGCHGATAPPALTLPALSLPPTTLGLPLAA